MEWRIKYKDFSKDDVIVKHGDIVTYTIRVYNEGKLDGYASEITDNIPEYLEARCAGYSKVPGALDYSNKLVNQMLDLKTLIKYDTSYKTTIEAYFIKIIRNQICFFHIIIC